jgi:hypothetical protein
MHALDRVGAAERHASCNEHCAREVFALVHRVIPALA